VKSTTVRMEGLNRYLRTLPKEAATELRAASQDIAARIASEAAGRARGLHPTAQLVAGTIKARRDRVPIIAEGGARKLPAHSDGRARTGARQSVGDVVWGAEFGSDRYRQFPPWRGSGKGAGYFMWPTVNDRSEWMLGEWSKALDRALQVTP
jgi:hypothetical protein